MLVGGVDVRELLARFKAAPGVIATYPEGHRLRILARPGAGAAIRAAATAIGASVEDTPKRLEDAAFVLVHDPEARSWALD